VLAFLVLGSVLAWWLRSPDLSAVIVAIIGRFPQILDPSLRFEGVVFLRGQVDMLQNFTSQLLAKGDWVTVDIRPRLVPVEFRVKCILTVAATDISVIVPTLNEEKYLPRCLKSLVNQTWDRPFEVLVVDGGSTDETVRVAKRYADKVLVKPKSPVGAARNLGAKAARGDILAFIDADTIANPQWLSSVDEAFRENPTIVGLTGPTLPYDGHLSDSITYRLWTIYLQRLLLYLEMPHVIGFNCAYRRGPFLSVGGFDENSVMSEDIKLAHKIRRYGKITFEKEMSALTSARRFRRYGHLYIGGLYLLNGFSTLLLNWSHSNYPPVR
jgi:glycosyltransferase involved in cell wall biosynthesis